MTAPRANLPSLAEIAEMLEQHAAETGERRLAHAAALARGERTGGGTGRPAIDDAVLLAQVHDLLRRFPSWSVRRCCLRVASAGVAPDRVKAAAKRLHRKLSDP